MSQRHFSLSEAAEHQSLQKQQQRKLRTVGSVSNLVPPQTLTLLADDAQTVGDYVYRTKDIIGEGYTSKVYRCRSLKKEGQFALKVIQIKKYSVSSMEMLENEITILKQLNHPNIIKFQDVYRNAQHCYLVTQYCHEGDLLEYVTRQGRLCEKQAIAVIGQIIQATKCLFRHNIVHRDIKPANVFRKHKVWKLGDFGFAIKAEGQIKTRQNVGTPLYMPLESLQRNLYSAESDLFAVGVIFYELMVGLTPWESRTEKELIKKMATVPFDVPAKYKITSSIKYLLSKMCQPNRDFRMTKEQFMDINVNNFASLIDLNERLRTQTTQRRARIFSVGKQQRQVQSKPKHETQYGRKASKNIPKVEGRSGSKGKVVDVKTYGSSSSKLDTNHSSEKGIDLKIQHKNYEILVVQLNFCRFMYYLIENAVYLQLNWANKGKVSLMLFKHLLKLIKQLSDSKTNWFSLSNWQQFRKSNKYVTTLKTLKDYCDKYQKQYLIFLKRAQINVIKQVNHKLPQFTSNDPFSIMFYRKILAFIIPYIKQCSQGIGSLNPEARQGKGQEGSARLEALKALFKYCKLVELSMQQFQNFGHFSEKSEISILKNYRQSKMTGKELAQIRQLIKGF